MESRKKRPLWRRPWCAADWQCLAIRGCGLDGLSEGKWCKTVALCFVALLGPMPVAPLNEMGRLACLLAGWLASWWTGWLPGWLAGRQATVALKIVDNLPFLLFFPSFFPSLASLASKEYLNRELSNILFHKKRKKRLLWFVIGNKSYLDVWQ